MILPKTTVVYIWPAGGAQAPGSPSQVGGVLASRGVGAPEDVRPPRGTCAPILCLGLPLAVLGLPLAVPKMFRAALGGPRAALGGLGLPLAVLGLPLAVPVCRGCLVDNLQRLLGGELAEVAWRGGLQRWLGQVDSLHGLGEVAWRRISTHDAYVAIVPLLRPDAMR